MNSRMLNYKRKEICAEVEKYTADVWGIFFFNINLFIYLFLAALGLHCWVFVAACE